jgi:hypothetical protein
MGAAMTRTEWQNLAELHLRAAKTLLKAKHWAAAYHLAGIAVECGLKACILVRLATATELIFVDRRFSEKCWTHNFDELVKLAGLEASRAAARATNPTFARYWLLVRDWTETSRYQRTGHRLAKAFVQAVADKKQGVLQWIRGHW